ncbi:MAG: homocysteine S-methyltransferase family protein [Ignavibacterium sp.]|nr:MAG: homocysteine S-methyltransferase family protein [Ignavibacterium sp.]
MKSILKNISDGKILVADGAMGSMLMQKGLQAGECPELLNLEKPEIVKEVAELYFESGADIIQTNTFGGTPLKLSDYSLEDKCTEINKAAVQIVKSVTDGKAFISGSCGPTGKMLEPFGEMSEDEAFNNFKLQTTALIDAGVDMLCIETMIDLNESLIAVKAARSNSEIIPIAATVTFNKTPGGFVTIMGNNIETVAKSLIDCGADIIGSNCGNGIENMVEIAKEFRNISNHPLLIQANAGIPDIVDGTPTYPETPEFFVERVNTLIDAGVSIIGGCCGTTPEHIRQMKNAVKSLSD